LQFPEKKVQLYSFSAWQHPMYFCQQSCRDVYFRTEGIVFGKWRPCVCI